MKLAKRKAYYVKRSGHKQNIYNFGRPAPRTASEAFYVTQLGRRVNSRQLARSRTYLPYCKMPAVGQDNTKQTTRSKTVKCVTLDRLMHRQLASYLKTCVHKGNYRKDTQPKTRGSIRKEAQNSNIVNLILRNMIARIKDSTVHRKLPDTLTRPWTRYRDAPLNNERKMNMYMVQFNSEYCNKSNLAHRVHVRLASTHHRHVKQIIYITNGQIQSEIEYFTNSLSRNTKRPKQQKLQVTASTRIRHTPNIKTANVPCYIDEDKKKKSHRPKSGYPLTQYIQSKPSIIKQKTERNTLKTEIKQPKAWQPRKTQTKLNRTKDTKSDKYTKGSTLTYIINKHNNPTIAHRKKYTTKHINKKRINTSKNTGKAKKNH